MAFRLERDCDVLINVGLILYLSIYDLTMHELLEKFWS